MGEQVSTPEKAKAKGGRLQGAALGLQQDQGVSGLRGQGPRRE